MSDTILPSPISPSSVSIRFDRKSRKLGLWVVAAPLSQNLERTPRPCKTTAKRARKTVDTGLRLCPVPVPDFQATGYRFNRSNSKPNPSNLKPKPTSAISAFYNIILLSPIVSAVSCEVMVMVFVPQAPKLLLLHLHIVRAGDTDPCTSK